MTPTHRSREHEAPGHGPSWIVRLRVRLAARRLDRRLAAGADPDAAPELRRRADQLVEPGERRHLAAVLERICAEAQGARRPFESVAPLAREAIRACPGEVEAIVARLEGEAPPRPQGVAAVAVLVHDDSPLRRPETPEPELRQALESTLRALAAG